MYKINEPTKSHIRARIFFSVAQSNEAWWYNFHKDKKNSELATIYE